MMPGLKWGDEADLMKAAEEWPEAVVLIEDWQERFPNMRWDFPTEIVFAQFPGRVVGNSAVMLPTKLALLRRLAATFECRVICCARDFFSQRCDPRAPRSDLRP